MVNATKELIEKLLKEREEILKKYGVSSLEELWEKIELGEISNVDAHDDLTRLDYIEYVLGIFKVVKKSMVKDNPSCLLPRKNQMMWSTLIK